MPLLPSFTKDRNRAITQAWINGKTRNNRTEMYVAWCLEDILREGPTSDFVIIAADREQAMSDDFTSEGLHELALDCAAAASCLRALARILY